VDSIPFLNEILRKEAKSVPPYMGGAFGAKLHLEDAVYVRDGMEVVADLSTGTG
jgi:hypothetical protein